MENKFINRDFEQFVKQNADQYRMFPSEKVWNGIHNTLHTRRRWYGIGFSLLLLTTAAVTGVMLSPSGKKQQAAGILTAPKSIEKQSILQKPEIVITQVKPANEKIAFVTAADRFQKDLFVNGTPATPLNEEIASSLPESFTDNTEPLIATATLAQPEFITKPAPIANNSKQTLVPVSRPLVNIIAAGPVKNTKELVLPYTDDEINSNAEKTTGKLNEFTLNLYKADSYAPFTIESVVNSYRHLRLRKKLSWQVYFTPTVSYRKLRENEAFLNASRPYTASPTNQVTDVNSVVTHKPDIGLQLGFAAGYPLSKKIKIITGLQFNVSKYDILAFSYPSEVATIALSTAAGGANTVSTFTNYRNSGGSSHADWLRNLYISASAPVGLEYKLAGNKKTYVGVGATVQPTYILSNRAYLISTDFKNYAEVPSLVRKWNVNTGFEIFAGYSTGKLNWRVSPQVRYQALSSFQAKYPVKEHLFDFGIKLGLMLKK